MIRNRKRLWALFLSAALMVTQLPAVAMAENNAPEDGSIASFAELPGGVADQSVEIGTELSALNLPDTVTAAIYHVTEDTVIPEDDNIEDDSGDTSTATPSDAQNSVSEGNDEGESSVKDSGKTVTTVTTSKKEIPVTWDSAPDYDGETADNYVFTADVGGYVLSDSTKLPQITVTVGADAAKKSTEKPTGETPSCTKDASCSLADGHEGECVTELPPVSNGLAKTVTGWNFMDTEYSDYIGNEFALPGVSMEQQADYDTVVSMLPVQISADIENETDPATVEITGWDCPEYVQDDSGNWPLTGEYTFTAKLPAGYACDPLPTVKVTLGGAVLYAADDLRPTGDFTVANGSSPDDYSYANNTLTINSSTELTISNTGTTTDKIFVPANVTANLTLAGVTINVAGQSDACAFAVEANGTANITLAQNTTNTLTSGENRAGLEVPKGATLTIGGSGSLKTTGGKGGAGIGGGRYGGADGGTITISGGTVNATGSGDGDGGAGIGGGYIGDGGTIKISGNADVTATGGGGDGDIYGGAGIGGGHWGAGGTIEISGGTVNATGGSNNYGGAGIGGGSKDAGGMITISGGTVKATGGGDDTYGGAGIGGGCWGAGGTIKISGNADVTATGSGKEGYGGAGIGGGSSGSGSSASGTIEISGGTVKATGGGGRYGGAGIGGGDKGATDTIKISSGTVKATGGGNGAGIGGGGKGGAGGTIEISGNADVTATGGRYGGAGIGGGGKGAGIGGGAGGDIIINGDTVVFAKGGGIGVNAIGSGEGSSSSAALTLTQGVVFQDKTGQVYGSPTLLGDVEIQTDFTLTVPAGSTLTNKGNFILNGVIDNGGTIDNQGTVTGNGQILNDGTIKDSNGAIAVKIDPKPKNSGGISNSGSSDSSSGGSYYTEPEPQSSYTVAGNNISQIISRSQIKELADSGKSLTHGCGQASMTFDPAALKAILAAVPSTAGNITFTAAPADLSAFPDAAKLIGAHPVYDFTISYKDSKGNSVVAPVNFPAGSASISLTYIPAAAEVTGSLFMVYVDGKGAVTWLDKSSYDSDKVLADVPHFSTYGVAYKTPVPVFSDIANHWAREDIEFVAAHGLLSGTGKNLFSPDGTMTRGMFVTALGRLAGVNPDSYQSRSFTDVKADAYYAAYVEWAVQKNIVKGTGDKLFSPDAPVTREQMAVMMTNYAGQMGYSIPAPLAAATFADNDTISTWAAKEVAAMQRAGIVRGKDGNRFDPQGNVTRAEMSAVLRRFVEIVIDPATADGWEKNDSGHWLYYKSGKALTGWQTIGKLRYYFNGDGVMHEGWKQDTDTKVWYYWTNAGAATGWREVDGKWYYFDENGVMAVNTRIDGYEIGPDGVRKEE